MSVKQKNEKEKHGTTKKRGGNATDGMCVRKIRKEANSLTAFAKEKSDFVSPATMKSVPVVDKKCKKRRKE